MSKLESIVPPLELCKQIPAGEFEDSVLVWRDCLCHGYYVGEQFAGENSDCRGEQKFDYAGNVAPVIMKATLPAPTLAEILDELGNKTVCLYDGIRYEVSVCIRERDSGTKEHQWRQYGEADRNPAAAALRLWLRIRREAGR